MSRRRKSLEPPERPPVSAEENHAVEEFAGLVEESMPKELPEADPFESYAYKLRTHFYSHEFRKKVANGYQLILNELKQSSQ